MLSLRDALETALVENPDDLATHRAYADYLQEQGDPRGEFIQVQLALEDPEKTTAQRRALQAREQELLAEHEREWLGILADELLGPIDDPWESLHTDDRPYEVRFLRGWLDRIVLRRYGAEHRDVLGELLCEAPESRLLRELVLECDEGVTAKLVDSPFLGNLRFFQLGVPGHTALNFFDNTFCPEVPDFVAKLPRLETLRLFATAYDAVRLFALPNFQHLRVLWICQMMTPYPLECLAENPALSKLTDLRLQPFNSPEPLIELAGVRAAVHSPHLHSLTHLQLRSSDLGDVGCTEIVTSGILKRLRMLDLNRGEITDAGARTLADCSDLKRLECLDIGRNGLTQAGIDALHRVLGPALRADYQQTAEALAQRQYLYDGPWE
jgi:uncharacterized protein (TIGR02996 family)